MSTGDILGTKELRVEILKSDDGRSEIRIYAGDLDVTPYFSSITIEEEVEAIPQRPAVGRTYFNKDEAGWVLEEDSREPILISTIVLRLTAFVKRYAVTVPEEDPEDGT